MAASGLPIVRRGNTTNAPNHVLTSSVSDVYVPSPVDGCLIKWVNANRRWEKGAGFNDYFASGSFSATFACAAWAVTPVTVTVKWATVGAHVILYIPDLYYVTAGVGASYITLSGTIPNYLWPTDSVSFAGRDLEVSVPGRFMGVLAVNGTMQIAHNFVEQPTFYTVNPGALSGSTAVFFAYNTAFIVGGGGVPIPPVPVPVLAFTGLTDTQAVYTNANSIMQVKPTGNGVAEVNVQVTVPALNQFRFASGTSSILSTAACTLDQNVSTTSNVSHNSMSITTIAANPGGATTLWSYTGDRPRFGAGSLITGTAAAVTDNAIPIWNGIKEAVDDSGIVVSGGVDGFVMTRGAHALTLGTTCNLDQNVSTTSNVSHNSATITTLAANPGGATTLWSYTGDRPRFGALSLITGTAAAVTDNAIPIWNGIKEAVDDSGIVVSGGVDGFVLTRGAHALTLGTTCNLDQNVSTTSNVSHNSMSITTIAANPGGATTLWSLTGDRPWFGSAPLLTGPVPTVDHQLVRWDGIKANTQGSTIVVDDAGNMTGVASVALNVGATISEFSIDGTLGDNSDAAVPTEKAVKTYADTKYASSNVTSGTQTVTLTGIWASDRDITIKWRKVGSVVTCQFGGSHTTANATTKITCTAGTILPAAIRPTTVQIIPIYTINGTSVTFTNMNVLTTGYIEIWSINGGNFTSGSDCGIYSNSACTWTLD